jgi:GxxExxY protein
MRKVESCFQRLEQRCALFTPGPARADHFCEMVSPAPADVVRTTLFSTRQQSQNRSAHRKVDTTGLLPTVVRQFTRSMHPSFAQVTRLTGRIIGAATEVHRDKGPGLIESIYQWCLEKELEVNGLSCVSQKVVTLTYKGFTREEPLRFDVLVEGCVLVEAKAVAEILPIHKAQLLSYMKLLDVPIGLLINFNEMQLRNGVHRLILPGSNRSS